MTAEYPIEARFDDLRADVPFLLALDDPYRVIAAFGLDEVKAAVAEAEAEAEAGGWVAGFVSYEAAPAFNDALVVRDSQSNCHWRGLGRFEQRLTFPRRRVIPTRLES